MLSELVYIYWHKKIDIENTDNQRFSSLFQSGAKPPFIEEMGNFEKDLLELPKKLEFSKCNNVFQKEMKENLQKMKNDNLTNVIIAAEKRALITGVT